jgi:hypothetical protein
VRILILSSALLFAAVLAYAQSGSNGIQPWPLLGPVPPDYMEEWTGTPCSYNYTQQESPAVGCWADGWCYKGGVALSVAFYQSWSCESGDVVNGYGASDYTQDVVNNVYTDYQNYYYANGVLADASAKVMIAATGYVLANYYGGLALENCAGTEYYSGPCEYER